MWNKLRNDLLFLKVVDLKRSDVERRPPPYGHVVHHRLATHFDWPVIDDLPIPEWLTRGDQSQLGIL